MTGRYNLELPMMIAFLVVLFATIVLVDLQSKTYWALTTAAIIGFYIVLGVIAFRYHCVVKDGIVSK